MKARSGRATQPAGGAGDDSDVTGKVEGSDALI
jgi:hypothetical protein